jgi:hypothetical protein
MTSLFNVLNVGALKEVNSSINSRIEGLSAICNGRLQFRSMMANFRSKLSLAEKIFEKASGMVRFLNVVELSFSFFNAELSLAVDVEVEATNLGGVRSIISFSQAFLFFESAFTKSNINVQ